MRVDIIEQRGDHFGESLSALPKSKEFPKVQGFLTSAQRFQEIATNCPKTLAKLINFLIYSRMCCVPPQQFCRSGRGAKKEA